MLITRPGENNLSFIETSALDASNVELAFQNILTGSLPSPAHMIKLVTDTPRNLPYRFQQGSRGWGTDQRGQP